jgi:transposase
MYVLSTGCQWRYVPKDLPPKSTLHEYLQRWEYDGTLQKIHCARYQECREKMGRPASPTACIVDSQSVKSTEKGGANLLIHPVMTRARRSKVRSGISWSIRRDFCCTR